MSSSEALHEAPTIALAVALPALAQDPQSWLSNLPQAKDYVQKRVSSYDTTGANADYHQQFNGGRDDTLLDVDGPGVITHIWFTIASGDPQHLKALVLRAYWDGESTPSVETPVGDFFGLGLGEYYRYQSIPLSVGSDKAMNSFFPMPFQKHARITVTNDGATRSTRSTSTSTIAPTRSRCPPDQLYFHAQYRQANPIKGTTSDWKSNGDMNDRKNRERRRQLRLDGGHGARALCRRHDVGAAEPGSVVGRRRRHVLHRRRVEALNQRHRLRRLLPRGVGICGRLVCIRAVWCSGQRERSRPAAVLPSIAFIWIRPSRSRSR